MLVGIMADSHDNLPMVEKAVDFFNSKKVELVLHAGDFVAPFVMTRLKGLKCPLVGVFGNNDGEREGLKEKAQSLNASLFPSPYSFVYKEKKILLLHDPKKLKGMDLSGYHLVVYGHTHEEEIKKEKNALLVNPGECGGWLTGKSTVALVNLELMEVEVKRLN
ncbi:metallophosphoesterase [Candidatus Aerophobetes bacterium]|nr:metallophosphoesterase [Candidatus Aerophobetes bacterium]